MSNEFVHASVGTGMTQAEFEAVGLHLFNNQATGDMLYSSSALQNGRLGIGSTNAILTVIGGVPTWQTTLAGLTLTAPVINGTIATTGLTLPAITLGGTVSGGGQTITNISSMSFAASGALFMTVNNSLLRIWAGDSSAGCGAFLTMYGKTSVSIPGYFILYTPNAAGTADVERLVIPGMAAIAVATWANITHSGFDITSGQVLKVSGTQVVGARVVDARADDVVDATYGAEEAGVLDALRDAMITHGLIAAA